MLKFCKSLKSKVLLFGAVIALSSFTIYKYVFDKNEVLMELLIGGLGQYHYSPVKIDDAFSEKVYTLYVKRLDRSKKFLLQSDVEQLAKYRRDIDNEINEGHFELYKLSNEMMIKRVAEKEAWYKDMLSKPFDYNVDEEYETDYDKLKFSATEAELKDEWRKMLKYQVLSRLDDALTKYERAQMKKDSATAAKLGNLKDGIAAANGQVATAPSNLQTAMDVKVPKEVFDSLETDARKKTLKANDDWFKRLNKLTPKDRFSSFINSIANIYDPHTEYFAPKEKKQFDQAMSGQFEGIGARLQQKDGIKVSEIIMGSPSYKQGELKAGDEIQKVGQGDKEPVDVTSMDMDDAIELIKGKKGTEVRLTVKKPDGTIKVIPIVRDIVPIEETFAKSAILNNNKRKIGYIYLPSFYTDFTRMGAGAHKCAADMRTEIEKLKTHDIEGLIVDIRDNGGGSLQEVVEMAGLFINKGPVVQVKARNAYDAKNSLINVMEDRSPDVAWDGPLSIMVNRNSASASEILAAAMQDYKRAVVVGSTTFGKGTVQSFLNLDQALIPQFDTLKPIGEVKITMQKFYRINGGATQLKGVTPDVILPNPYEYVYEGEKEMEFPMPWDEIEKATYTSFGNINYDRIKKTSDERVKKNTIFKLLETEAKELKAKKDDSKYSLKLDKYRAEQKQWRDQNKKYEDIKKDIKDFTAELVSEDVTRLGADTARLGRETRWAKNLAKDVYVHEVSNIISDLKMHDYAQSEKK